MRLVSFDQDDQIKVGLVQNGMVVDVSHEFPDILSIIKEGDIGLQKLKEIASFSKETSPISNKRLVAPIQSTRNIMCVGWNYLKHFNERENQDLQLPEHPNVFTKATTTISGPFEDIPLSSEVTKKFDYEAELAVIIGKSGSNIPEDEALDYVFGYTVANDLSARDIQHTRGGQWFLGKSIDKSCPIGPWIVMKDEVPDPQNLDISCKVNGEIVQSSNTSLMIFPVKKIIAEISQIMTLMPGDIILTGTPEGIGAKRNPPLFLKPGDTVEVEVSGIGKIQNRIVSAITEDVMV